MKTSKQDIHDLLAAIANDVEEINVVLNGNDGATDIATATDYAATGNDSATANQDRIIAEVTRLLEPIAQTCSKLPDRFKSYYAQLLLRIPQDLREELARDNDTRKRKGQPTVEDKIDNTLTMAVAVYDRLNQIEDAMRPSTPSNGQPGQKQSANGKSTNDKSAKLKIVARLKSVWSSVRRFCTKRQARWYCKPHILCAVVVYILYFGFSIYSFQRWHYYRDENTRLRLTADKYRVDSTILRELYPQAATTLSAYEHITETEGAEKAIEVFRGKFEDIKNQY